MLRSTYSLKAKRLSPPFSPPQYISPYFPPLPVPYFRPLLPRHILPPPPSPFPLPYPIRDVVDKGGCFLGLRSRLPVFRGLTSRSGHFELNAVEFSQMPMSLPPKPVALLLVMLLSTLNIRRQLAVYLVTQDNNRCLPQGTVIDRAHRLAMGGKGRVEKGRVRLGMIW